MSDEIHRDIGRHDEAIENLKTEVAAMRVDVAAIKSMMEQTKGGWKTLLAVGTLAGGVGAWVVKIFATAKGVQ